MHPRNRHSGRYDFACLIAADPALARFVRPNPHDVAESTIDFADPQAVKALNRALLKSFHGIADWDIPSGYLCPPIPGRADYLHHLADLLAGDHRGAVPTGRGVRVLDLGVGANGVYPLVGHAEYGWRFIGSDVDANALAAARRVLDANPAFAGAIDLRLQARPDRLFGGVLKAGEVIDAAMCNPPFHASAAAAREGSERKRRNLGQAAGRKGEPVVRNFGGQSGELWCEGGERRFVQRMIAESSHFRTRCLWFTSLVSKEASLPPLGALAREAGAVEVRTVDMAQGQKRSRFLAWTFFDGQRRAEWAQRRWSAQAEA